MHFLVALRYTSLLTLGLMAGGAFAFILGLPSSMASMPMVAAASFHETSLPLFSHGAGVVYAFIAFVMIADLYLNRRRWKSLEFILVLFALLCLLDEAIMTWSGFLPVDRWITVWDLVYPPNSWMDMSTQWLRLMYIRSTLLVTSFALLLAATFLIKKNLSSHSDGAAAS